MRCRATLEARVRDPGSLARALEPDNRAAPPGITVECRSDDSVLVCVVEVDCSEPLGVLRLRNTIDDLLQDLSAAINALKAAG